MKIDSIKLYLVNMKLKNPFRTSFGETQERNILLVKIQSGEYIGYGECVAEEGPWYSSETIESCKSIIKNYIVPWVKKTDISKPNDFRELVKPIKGNQMAKACVEDAIWVLYGEMTGKSLKELLNGTKDEIPSGISLGIQKTKEILLEKIETALQKNYQRIKIKIEPGWDVQIVKTIRDIYPEISLMVDANSAYRLKDIEIFKSLDRYNLMMIEQPLQYYDILDHAKLQKEINTPICLDESIKSVDDARVAIDAEATQIINVKPSRVGGITETLLIHEYAKTLNFPLWCGGMLETGIGRAKNVAVASLSSFTLPNDISETERYYTNHLIDPIFELNTNGTISVPDKLPGLGVNVLHDAIKKYSIDIVQL